MARKGFLRRLIDRIVGTKPTTVKPPQPPQPRSTRPSPPVSAATLRQRAVDNIINQTAYSKRSTVVKGVSLMTIDELRWTIRATYDQIANAARQQPDRLLNGMIPWNSWWYQ